MIYDEKKPGFPDGWRSGFFVLEMID